MIPPGERGARTPPGELGAGTPPGEPGDASRPAADQLPSAVGPGVDPLPPEVRAAVEAATTARLFLPGGSGAYGTGAWLQLRADHAAARDAVRSELDLTTPTMADWVARCSPLVVETSAAHTEHLTRPDLGRRLAPRAAADLARAVAAADRLPCELAIVIGDGLSATAVEAQAPALADALVEGAAARGWRVSEPPVVVRRCRVGVLNDLGPLLGADVVVLLVGERPGMVAADSISAYLGYRPRPGHTDADRNLVSGIHERGTPVADAAVRILDLVGVLLDAGVSGVSVKASAVSYPHGILPGSDAR